MKYAYPAIIQAEADGLYSVEFPDIDGCVTSGSSLPDDPAFDVVAMAAAVVSTWRSGPSPAGRRGCGSRGCGWTPASPPRSIIVRRKRC